MAIDVGQSAVNSVSASASVATGAITTAASGSSFLYIVQYDQSFTSLVDSKGNSIGTPILAESSISYFSGLKTRIYLCTNGTGGASHTATLTQSGSGAANVYLIEVTGGALSSLLDVISTPVEDNATPFTTNLTGTLSQANELAIAVYAFNTGGGTATATFGNSFTAVKAVTDADLYYTSAVGKLVVAATTSIQGSVTLSAGTGAWGLILTLKAAGAAGPSVAVLSSSLYRRRRIS